MILNPLVFFSKLTRSDNQSPFLDFQCKSLIWIYTYLIGWIGEKEITANMPKMFFTLFLYFVYMNICTKSDDSK